MLEIVGFKNYSKKEEPIYISNDLFKIDISGLKEKELLILSGIFASCNMFTRYDLTYHGNEDKFYRAVFSVNDFIRKFITSKKSLTVQEKKALLIPALRKISHYSFHDDRNGDSFIPIFRCLHLDEKVKLITITVNPEFMYLFTEFGSDNPFTKYYHSNLQILTSKYVKSLYRFIERFHKSIDKKGIIEVCPAELKKQIGMKESESASNVKRTLENAKRQFIEKGIFPNFDYRVITEIKINSDLQRYKVVK